MEQSFYRLIYRHWLPLFKIAFILIYSINFLRHHQAYSQYSLAYPECDDFVKGCAVFRQVKPEAASQPSGCPQVRGINALENLFFQ